MLQRKKPIGSSPLQGFVPYPPLPPLPPLCDHATPTSTPPGVLFMAALLAIHGTFAGNTAWAAFLLYMLSLVVVASLVSAFYSGCEFLPSKPFAEVPQRSIDGSVACSRVFLVSG